MFFTVNEIMFKQLLKLLFFNIDSIYFTSKF